MNEPSTALPAEWILRLFQRLQAIYGNRVTTMWADADPNEVRQVWAEKLGEFTGDDLRYALEQMQLSHKDYPPTLPQFTDLCRDGRARRAGAAVKLPGPREPIPPSAKAFLGDFLSKHRVQ